MKKLKYVVLFLVIASAACTPAPSATTAALPTATQVPATEVPATEVPAAEAAEVGVDTQE